MRDHLISSSCSWSRLLELVEQERRPFSQEKQKIIKTVDGVHVDLSFISNQLWAFVGNHLSPNVYSNRLSMVGGEEYNGLELWRKLYLDNEGGAEQVVLSGIRRFHGFPKCPSKAKIGAYLGEWEALRMKYGGHMPDWNLYGMLINMLPDDVAGDIRRLPNLNSSQKVLDYLH